MRTIAQVVTTIALVVVLASPPASAKMKLGGITISGHVDLGWLAKIGAQAFTAHMAAKAAKHAAPSPSPAPTAIATQPPFTFKT